MDIEQNTKSGRQSLKKYYSLLISGIVFFLLLLLFTSCQDNQSDIITTSGGENNFSAGFYSEPAGDNSLQLTEVKFVLRKLVLEPENNGNECDVKLGPFII